MSLTSSMLPFSASKCRLFRYDVKFHAVLLCKFQSSSSLPVCCVGPSSISSSINKSSYKSQYPTCPHLCALPAVQLWPHIQIKARSSHFIALASVKVDYILDFGSASVYHPVVAIERRRVPQQAVETSLWGHLARKARERIQAWATGASVHIIIITLMPALFFIFPNVVL